MQIWKPIEASLVSIGLLNKREKEMTNLLRVDGAAHYLAISKSQVWKLTASGILKSYKLSERVTVWKISELDEYIAQKIGEL